MADIKNRLETLIDIHNDLFRQRIAKEIDLEFYKEELVAMDGDPAQAMTVAPLKALIKENQSSIENYNKLILISEEKIK